MAYIRIPCLLCFPEGLDITRESDGAFDIAIAPLTSLWDFTAEDPKAPDDADIQKVLPPVQLRRRHH